MKYKDLIEIFSKFADEEVSIVTCLGNVIFYPASDGDKEIIVLGIENDEPFKAFETSM